LFPYTTLFRSALKNVLGFIKEFRPDEVIQIGDLMDFPQPSRWSKDTRAEFEGSVFRDAEYGIKNFVKPLRDVYDGPVKVIEGNHDERPRVYLEKYAPALAESRRSEEHTSELQSRENLVCRLLLEKKKK